MLLLRYNQDESEEESDEQEAADELLGRGARGALLKDKTRVSVFDKF